MKLNRHHARTCYHDDEGLDDESLHVLFLSLQCDSSVPKQRLISWRPSSFYEKIHSNLKLGLHTMCLLDIKVQLRKSVSEIYLIVNVSMETLCVWLPLSIVVSVPVVSVCPSPALGPLPFRTPRSLSPSLYAASLYSHSLGRRPQQSASLAPCF